MRRPILHALVPGLLDCVSCWAKGYGEIPVLRVSKPGWGESSRHLFPAQGIEATLCALLELAATTYDDLPLEAVRRYGFGGDADTGPWLCADPVYLRADVTRVFLQHSDWLNIIRCDADRLGALLGRILSARNCGLKLQRLYIGICACGRRRLSAPILSAW
ncbi:MAG TPA: hypothetical protein VHJ19_04945 [Gammaproteobacteria bacterium]|nr:hypothetical protein [Gammaproteobacteria bacterium]